MTDAIISVENLGKRYSIRHERERYTALRDVVAEKAKNLFRRNGRKSLTSDLGPLMSGRTSKEDFWALKNVSFEVRRGDVVGIIGRNGAGKSTLLKILSRITEPTEGKVHIKGRVASLLEVGTGFHPELTGRENIFLNGAILGMTRAEIKSKFDEIVAFAETEKFLDTPVKRYSSGMYVRLAFAVAAHLEPEILVIDEVLAVGDIAFQKKCLGKMEDVARGEGKTVLFVSHNMAVLRMLCQRAIQLHEGRVVAAGPAAEITNQYSVNQRGQGSGIGKARRLDPSLDLLGLDFDPQAVASGMPLNIRVSLRARSDTALHEASIIIHADTGQRVAILDLRQPDEICRMKQDETVSYNINIDEVPLMEGVYEVGFYFRSDHGRDELFALRDLLVVPGRSGCRVAPYPAQNRGFVELDYRFEVDSSTVAK